MRGKLFLSFHSFATRFFIVSFLVIVVGGYVVWVNSKPTEPSFEGLAPQSKEIKTPYLSQTPPVRTPTPSNLKHVPLIKRKEDAPQVKQETNQEKEKASDTIFISLAVNEHRYNVEVPRKSSVYEAMNIAQERGLMEFKGKEFSGMGFFVEEINGVKNNYQKGMYWIYYINGKKATMGISSYMLSTGDTIVWKYEANED